jgi:hypothetical protein
MAKGTGLVLSGVPLISVVLAGRTDLLRRFRFWYPALIVLVVCGPWYLLVPGARHERVAVYGGLGLARRYLTFPAIKWADVFGWPVAALALIGIGILVHRWISGSRLNGIWASAGALIICANIFPIFVKAWEVRHFLESAPVFLLVAALGAGGFAVVGRFMGLASSSQKALLVLATLAVVGWNLGHLPRQQSTGYRQLAEAIVAGEVGPAQTILISGLSLSEGKIISEIAQREPRPTRYVVRATKLLSQDSWMGRARGTRVAEAEVPILLQSLPLDVIVIDGVDAAPGGYQQILEKAVAEHPETWGRDESSSGERLQVYRRTDGKTSDGWTVARRRAHRHHRLRP